MNAMEQMILASTISGPGEIAPGIIILDAIIFLPSITIMQRALRHLIQWSENFLSDEMPIVSGLSV